MGGGEEGGGEEEEEAKEEEVDEEEEEDEEETATEEEELLTEVGHLYSPVALGAEVGRVRAGEMTMRYLWRRWGRL